MAMGAPICRREHTAVSQPLGWSSRQAATLLEFYQNAFGVLTHWAFERAPVLAGRFGLNASEHHLGAALWAFRTYDSRCWTGRCIHGKPPYSWRKYRTALERKLFNIAHRLPRGIHASGNATPSAELILILAHLLHGNSIAALGRRRHRATGGKTPICVGCHTAVKGAVLICRGSGRKSEAPARAA